MACIYVLYYQTSIFVPCRAKVFLIFIHVHLEEILYPITVQMKLHLIVSRIVVVILYSFLSFDVLIVHN